MNLDKENARSWFRNLVVFIISFSLSLRALVPTLTRSWTLGKAQQVGERRLVVRQLCPRRLSPRNSLLVDFLPWRIFFCDFTLMSLPKALLR